MVDALSSKDEAVIENARSGSVETRERCRPAQVKYVSAFELKEEREDIMKLVKSLSMLAAVALTGTGLLVTSSANAQSRGENPVMVFGQRVESDLPTEIVSYRDLNLATLAGEKSLQSRVSGAVRRVCVDTATYGALFEEISCRNFAWAGARPQIARALMRAREIASTGTSSILPVAITLSAGRQ